MEGIRAVLIDRDQPKWTFENVKGIKESDIKPILDFKIDKTMDELLCDENLDKINF